MFTAWYSTEDFADYIIHNTGLKSKEVLKKKLYESDANNPTRFHTVPDHIKKILYLDAPDLIIEYNSEPILSIEISREAGTGHNVFQRFARIAASVENNVPAFYIYPDAVVISRSSNGSTGWDKLNPLIFHALESVMQIYSIPALFFHYPSLYSTSADQAKTVDNKGLINDAHFRASPDSNSTEMQAMFECINELLATIEKEGVHDGGPALLANLTIRERRNQMSRLAPKELSGSPLSSTVKVPTEYVINSLAHFEKNDYKVGELLRSRKETIIYKVNAQFRGDPYPGALAAIDYMLCREGKTFEDRRYNLVMAWGDVIINHEKRIIEIAPGNGATIKDWALNIQASEQKNLLNKDYSELTSEQIPRYYMQARYGSTFSKVKHIRVYSYFADAILFPDGALWRDA